MKQVLITAALALPLLSACGDKEEQPYFQVLGEAQILKDAEVFRISFALGEHNKDRAKSLAAASKRLDEIRDRLGRLKGLEQLGIETGEAKVESVLPNGCEPDKTYGNPPYPESCEPVDYITSFVGTVQGSPATAAGSVISMLSELGVGQVSTAHFDVMDREAAEMEVRRAALKDAMATARALAEQAGVEIGAPVEVKYGQGGYDEAFELGELPTETRIAAPGLLAPRQPLKLPPAKVRLQDRVAVKFALRQTKAEK